VRILRKHPPEDSVCRVANRFSRARLPALYSDFRGLRSINPDGYAANVSAWRAALAGITRSGLAPSRTTPPNVLVLDADEALLRALESKQYGRPLALGVVVREAALAKDLVPLPDFLKAKESIYYTSWTSLPWNVVSWGLRQLGLTGGNTDKLPGGRFVVVANAEAAARAFGDKTADAASRFERTWSRAHFKKTFAAAVVAGQRLSDTDLDVLLKFLSRDKESILYDGHTIKVKVPGEEGAEITPEDQAISQLKELTEYLSHQTTVLSKRIEELSRVAKEAVGKKNRVAALAALKSKKLAEASLERRFATLTQLEEVASKIEEAADQVQIVKAMATSTDALSSLNAQVGSADRVEEVVDRLREQMGAVDEVNSILAESAPVLDEGEIDDELAALESEEKEKADKARLEKEAADRGRKDAELEKEAEAIRHRLEAIEALKTSAITKVTNEAVERNVKSPGVVAGEVLEQVGRISLEDKARPEAEAEPAA